MSLEGKLRGYLEKGGWERDYEDFTPDKKALFEKVLGDCARSNDVELPGEEGSLAFAKVANCVFNQCHLYAPLQHS